VGRGEAEIAAAVRDALDDHTLAVNANRLARAIRQEVAADRAVAELEALPNRTAPVSAQPLISDMPTY
jgi:UDP:flavonoid glycosyltransferase YjiC (YdhE family)